MKTVAECVIKRQPLLISPEGQTPLHIRVENMLSIALADVLWRQEGDVNVETWSGNQCPRRGDALIAKCCGGKYEVYYMISSGPTELGPDNNLALELHSVHNAATGDLVHKFTN